MAGPARSEEFLEDDGEPEMRRRLFKRFMASCGPVERPYLYLQAEEVPCLLYTMRVSVKDARVSWSNQSSSRLIPGRRGSWFPIPLCRAAGPDGKVEPLVDRSGKLDRLGIVTGVYEESYHLLEFSREKGVIHMEGSPASWKEVAVIRGAPGGRGLSVTSHVKYLVVRLHDILFVLSGPSATVDIRFSERRFRLPARWTEERLYAEDGFHIVDIGFSVENLARKLYLMREHEAVQIGRSRFETEEEREMGLEEEEATRQQQQETWRKIRELQDEERRREEMAYKHVVWDAALWLINDTHPAAARRYSKFKLSMDRNGIVSCNCVEQEGLHDMLLRVDDLDFVLPISKTNPSSGALETLGSVEGYLDIEFTGFGPRKGHFMDVSGRTLSSLVMVSHSAAKVLTIVFDVDRLDILLDDGMVISGHSDVSVDIHCDDISALELLKTNWVYSITCKNTEIEGRISFSALFVQLKKKLNLQLTKDEWELYSSTAVDMGEEQNEDLLERAKRRLKWILPSQSMTSKK